MRTTLIIFVTVVLLQSGCGRKAASLAPADDGVAVGPQFSAKHGLLVPEETRRAIGFKVAEITEQNIPATSDLQLRVYELRNGKALATALVSPDQAKSFLVGEPLQIRGEGNTNIDGKITAINGGLRHATGMIEVLAEFPATSDIAPGAFVFALVHLDPNRTVLAVPRTALLDGTEGPAVYTVSGEHLVRTPVKTGAENGQFVEIKDGLYPGDQVVVESAPSLWLAELAATKGGQACCVVPAKGK